MQQYFDVAVEDTASIAACASCYFEKYAHLPEQYKKPPVPVAPKNNAANKSEAEMLLADLDEYGI